MIHEIFMQRCLELAQQGAGFVAPNPMVGCVIVHEGKIIGEGFHQKFGEPHAEVNAIHSVIDSSLLPYCTLFVNLEPCSHYGKTPPCADLIIQNKIREVIIGCLDPNPLVAGNGVKKLINANIKVQIGILEKESRELNRRFITFHEKKRPYIILKWAQTSDGFIAPSNGERINISNEYSRTLVHRWRSEEAAVIVGTNTAANDNPKLDARLWNNRKPIRIVFDRDLKLSSKLFLFDHSALTIIVTEKEKNKKENLEFFRTEFSNSLLQNVISHLYQKQIQSAIVEGGAKLLNSFIDEKLWDEARIFISPNFLSDGITASKVSGNKISDTTIFGDRLVVIKPIA